MLGTFPPSLAHLLLQSRDVHGKPCPSHLLLENGGKWKVYTPRSLTAGLPLKTDGWKITFLLGWFIFRGELLNFQGVCGSDSKFTAQSDPNTFQFKNISSVEVKMVRYSILQYPTGYLSKYEGSKISFFWGIILQDTYPFMSIFC